MIKIPLVAGRGAWMVTGIFRMELSCTESERGRIGEANEWDDRVPAESNPPQKMCTIFSRIARGLWSRKRNSIEAQSKCAIIE